MSNSMETTRNLRRAATLCHRIVVPFALIQFLFMCGDFETVCITLHFNTSRKELLSMEELETLFWWQLLASNIECSTVFIVNSTTSSVKYQDRYETGARRCKVLFSPSISMNFLDLETLFQPRVSVVETFTCSHLGCY